MMGKKLLKHPFGSSTSTPPSFIPSATTTRASDSSEPSTPSLTPAKPVISLPPALAALVPQTLLYSTDPLPRLVVFDLDYTLWPFWVDTHPVAPVKPQSTPAPAPISLPSTPTLSGTAQPQEPPPQPATSVGVVDRHGETYAFYPDVPSMLWILPRMGMRIAIASRTHAPDLGKEFLKLMVITPPAPDDASSLAKKELKPRRPADLFDGGMEIYPGSKIAHMQALARRNAVAFEDILFFDDEPRNLEVEALGVTMQLVPDGVSWGELERGIEAWRRKRS